MWLYKFFKKQKTTQTIHPPAPPPRQTKCLRDWNLHRTWCCQSSSLWLQGPAAPSWAIGWRKCQSSCSRCNGPHWVYPASPPAGSPGHLELWRATQQEWVRELQQHWTWLLMWVEIEIKFKGRNFSTTYYFIFMPFPHCSIQFCGIKFCLHVVSERRYSIFIPNV